jgi:hypothetical protein
MGFPLRDDAPVTNAAGMSYSSFVNAPGGSSLLSRYRRRAFRPAPTGSRRPHPYSSAADRVLVEVEPSVTGWCVAGSGSSQRRRSSHGFLRGLEDDHGRFSRPAPGVAVEVLLQ